MENQKIHKTCKNAIFDAIWGEYKCDIHKRVVRSDIDCPGCELYKEGTPTESKRNSDYYESFTD